MTHPANAELKAAVLSVAQTFPSHSGMSYDLMACGSGNLLRHQTTGGMTTGPFTSASFPR